jgi:hypothetical protein
MGTESERIAGFGRLEERAFGLTGAEGNHGEDVKEYVVRDLRPKVQP